MSFTLLETTAFLGVKSWLNKNSISYSSGLVRGGSGGSADPPKILEPVEKKLEIDILS